MVVIDSRFKVPFYQHLSVVHRRFPPRSSSALSYFFLFLNVLPLFSHLTLLPSLLAHIAPLPCCTSLLLASLVPFRYTLHTPSVFTYLVSLLLTTPEIRVVFLSIS